MKTSLFALLLGTSLAACAPVESPAVDDRAKSIDAMALANCDTANTDFDAHCRMIGDAGRYFLQLRAPRVDFPWSVELGAPMDDRGWLSEVQIELVVDANRSLLEGLGYDLSEASFDTRHIGLFSRESGRRGKAVAIVTWVDHIVDGRRVLMDRIIVSRRVDGSVDHILAKWDQDLAYDASILPLSAASVEASYVAGEEAISAFGSVGEPSVEEVWLRTEDGEPELAVAVQFQTANGDGSAGIGIQKIFLDGELVGFPE